MADKRISQLIERVDIANNDVLPIVASGATTTNKVTISTIQDWMQSNLDVGVTSVGLTMPSAFQVSGSPITTSGNINVTATGTASQYIRGDGTLADFPQGSGGGGASVSYYLNGSVSQGTIGGIAYLEMNKTPILGAGTDFTISSDGYIASFITDAGDPALLQIPAGNWNFETYLQASSGGGTPTFYIELYKVDSGGTATLIASNSGSPELIAFGTTINPYFSALAVPQTTLALTDRLAIRYYVTHSGRTITLHTENNTLCQIITTFTTGLTALNGLTAQVQNFATGTSGTDFNISSTGSIHTFNLPDASASNRGVVTTGTQTFAGYKIFNGTIGVNNDIQLATQGTALNTFIKNINSTGLTSIGSNGFGFNNANNIYFSGSNKGGGVFAFSNTGTQIYTLPNASGTISLTSDLGAYLPLSGGTMTGAINGISANFTSNLSSDSGVYSNTAFFAKHNPGSTVTVNGWNAMQGDANTFIVLNSTKGMRINFPSNASFTHTLPDASGTIALTSNLSSYLPLSGGTLTGALNGTSATLSSNFYVSGGTNTNTGNGVHLFNESNFAQVQLNGATGSLIDFSTSGSDFLGRIIYTNSTNAMQFHTNSGANPALTLASTGAATFSSSVTVGGGVGHKIELKDGAAWPTIRRNTSTGGIIFDTEGSSIAGSIFSVKTLNGSDFVTVTSGGNVGIGTSSPSDFIDASLGLAIISTSGRSGLSLGSTQSSADEVLGRLSFTNTNSTNAGSKRLAYISGIRGTTNNSAYLEFATANDGLGTQRMVISQTGNVGIGTASPSGLWSGDNRNLNILSPANNSSELVLSRTAGSVSAASVSNFLSGTTADFGIYTTAALNYVVYTNNTERMRITSGGNTVLGGNAGSGWSTASGRTTLEIYGSSFPLAIHNSSSVGNSLSYNTYWDGSNWRYVGATYSVLYIQDGEGHKFFHNGAGTAGASFSPTERMRITSGGNVLVGTSTANVNLNGIQVNSASGTNFISVNTSTSGIAMRFYTGTSVQAGYIAVDGSTTSYVTSSDYRLKENVKPVENALSTIEKLKPCTFNFISEPEKEVVGFLAHEVQEIIPQAIHGEKDAVTIEQVEISPAELDEEGNVITEAVIEEKEVPVYQGIDHSKLVPLLVAAMQEQQEQIKSLTEQVEALKSQING